MADEKDAQYLVAIEHIGELSLHARQLESELAELRRAEKPPADIDRENDELWTALAYHACTCMPEAEKQVEVFLDINDHGLDCQYVKIASEIKARNAK